MHSPLNNGISLTSLLGLSAKITVLGVLPAHLPLVLDAGILVSVPPLSCAGCRLDNTHCKDSGVHYHGPYFY